MNKLGFLLLFVGLFSFLSAHAQSGQKLDSILRHYSEENNAIDSLVKASQEKIDDTLKVDALARLANNFRYKAPALSKRFALEELYVSKKINYSNGQMWGNFHLGSYFQNAGINDSARYFFNESLKISNKQGKSFSSADILNSLAAIDYNEGKYDQALAKYDKALLIYKDASMYDFAITNGDRANIYINKGFYKIALQETLKSLKILDTVHDKPWRAADAQRQVGYIEFLRDNYDSALSYFKKAAKVYKEQEDNIYLSSIYDDIGNTFFYLKKNDSALYYLQKGLVLAKDNQVSKNEGNLLSNLGKVYTQMGDYNSALEHLERALEIHVDNNFKTNTLWTQNYIGNAYIQMNRPERAVPFLTKTIVSAKDDGSINELRAAYKYRFEAFKQIGNLENAIEDQLEFQKLSDSIFNEKSAQQIEELRIIYETEKKEQQITLQQNEITVLQQQASISNLQKLLLGFGLLLSLIGFYAIRQKMKRNRIAKEKVDAELAFKKKELTTHALNLARKNETLENLKVKALELKKRETGVTGYNQLIRSINFNLQDDNNWENFSRYFEEVHKDFNRKVKTKYPEVTSNELRLLALLKMNLSSKEIASILSVSPEGIKKARYRLRKKLDIATEDSLQDLVLSL